MNLLWLMGIKKPPPNQKGPCAGLLCACTVLTHESSNCKLPLRARVAPQLAGAHCVPVLQILCSWTAHRSFRRPPRAPRSRCTQKPASATRQGLSPDSCPYGHQLPVAKPSPASALCAPHSPAHLPVPSGHSSPLSTTICTALLTSPRPVLCVQTAVAYPFSNGGLL